MIAIKLAVEVKIYFRNIITNNPDKFDDFENIYLKLVI